MLFNIHKLEELKSMLNDITDYIIPSDSNILASTKSKAIGGPYKSVYLLAIFHTSWSTFPFSQSQGRESIAAKLVANMITEAGANRVLVCDLHSSQAMGYFDIPVDHVYGQVCTEACCLYLSMPLKLMCDGIHSSYNCSLFCHFELSSLLSLIISPARQSVQMTWWLYLLMLEVLPGHVLLPKSFQMHL